VAQLANLREKSGRMGCVVTRNSGGSDPSSSRGGRGRPPERPLSQGH